MQTKRNPAPWEAKELYGNWVIVDVKNNVIRFAENEANAKLIAAAPELLEELKELISFIYTNYDHSEAALLYADKAQTVIDKASL